MSTNNEEFNVKRSAFPRKAKEQTLINKETITVIMEVLEANNAMEENLRGKLQTLFNLRDLDLPRYFKHFYMLPGAVWLGRLVGDILFTLK